MGVDSRPSNVHLTKEHILARVTEEEIFKRYIEGFPGLNVNFSSPFRKDKHPSCKVFKGRRGIRMKDHTTKESFDCFSLVQNLYSETFVEALRRIDADFNLGLSGGKIKPVRKREQGDDGIRMTRMNYTERHFNREDYAYWGQWGFTKKFLDFCGVKAISYYWKWNVGWISQRVSGKAYVYTEWNPFFKFYFPDKDKEVRFLGNVQSNHIQGYKLLPKKGDLCIITSSFKDAMFLTFYGLPAIAPQSEVGKLPPGFAAHLLQRFASVVVLYDNDFEGESNWGQISAAKLIKIHPELFNVCLPDIAKDPTDLAKIAGNKETIEIIKREIVWQTGIEIEGISMSDKSDSDTQPF